MSEPPLAPAFLPAIRTVLFDLDGTLTVPCIDFESLRRRLGLPNGRSIVHALAALPAEEAARGHAVVLEVEIEAAHDARPAEGAVALVRRLQERGIATGVVTRNHPEPVRITLDALGLDFPAVVTRECAAPKPAPDAVLLAMKRLSAAPAATLMVGDWHDDIAAGRAAKTRTCFVTRRGERRSPEADFSVDSPAALLRLFEQAWGA